MMFQAVWPIVAPGKSTPAPAARLTSSSRRPPQLAMAGRIDAITTLPLNKLALHQAGVVHPGHTEILAEYCRVPDHAMMLYLENDGSAQLTPPQLSRSTETHGLGVVHVTLARRSQAGLRADHDRIRALQDPARRPAMRPLTGGLPPRIAVSSLNPHAGEEGLFGDEELTQIAPAVAPAREQGIDVQGPFPNDTLFYHALAGDFDAVVAMYHDQGHIALKTVGFDRAVNVTLGLPIVRTSVAHGTAFDIAGQGPGRSIQPDRGRSRGRPDRRRPIPERGWRIYAGC